LIKLYTNIPIRTALYFGISFSNFVDITLKYNRCQGDINTKNKIQSKYTRILTENRRKRS